MYFNFVSDRFYITQVVKVLEKVTDMFITSVFLHFISMCKYLCHCILNAFFFVLSTWK